MNNKKDQPKPGAPSARRRVKQVATTPILPESDGRRDHIIAAAQTVFYSKGYYSTRMDEIAAAAGMSKRTIYQMFPSKEELFEALLAQRMASSRRCELNPSQPLETAIAALLFDCALWVLSPDGIAITRLIMGEYSRSPELGRLLKSQGYKRFVVCLEKSLSMLAATGRHQIDDPREATRMLIGMVVGDLHYDLLIGVSQTTPKAAIKRRTDRAIKIFLAGTKIG